jgi:hypothetical protein
VGDERAQAAYPNEELAWAAGLYDGEGSCGCYGRSDGKKRKASYWHLRLHVAQHYDPEVLHRFVAAVGVGKVYGPYEERKYSVQVVGKNAEIIIEKIWPWLSGPKRRQIEAAREKFLQRPEPSLQGLGGGQPCPPGCTCGRHGRYSTEGLTEKQIRRREKMREYQARHRAKLKESA